MFTIFRQEEVVGGKPLVLEIGRVARQALGAVFVSHGEARILCTVEASPDPLHRGFLPLSVHYQEKASAAGKVPGGFLKRESKPSDEEVLISRIIDRSLRPLFAPDFHHEVQITCTVFSFDPEVDLAVTALLGASAALMLSGLPVKGPIAGIRLGHENGAWVKNLLPSITDGASLDLLVAGTKEGIVMVECACQDKEETFMVEALAYAHESLQSTLDFLERFIHQVEVVPFAYRKEEEEVQNLLQEMEQEAEWEQLLRQTHRKQRHVALSAFRKRWVYQLQASGLEGEKAHSLFTKVWRSQIRKHILSCKKRLDGRDYREVRPIACEVGLLPRAHGSALFTRGDTQALVSITLGGKEDGQLVDSLTGSRRDFFLLHYTFPPFAVGEVGKVGSPGRREIGHGKLAMRALSAVMPFQDFPMLRISSEITESCGSSSMATVCGSSLALMDAGIKIRQPVAGIAMGLIQEGGDVAILSDISGLEDGIGDMDLKVAGTSRGITALHMDLKGDPLSKEMMARVLEQAQEGRLHILSVMSLQTLDRAREHRSPHAPLHSTIRINPAKIRDLIGPGGKTIREICESTGSKIDIAEDGLVSIFSHGKGSAEKALARIQSIVGGVPPVVGEVYRGVIVDVVDFGAFVDFGFANHGMVHISEISAARVEDIRKALSVGDEVKVKLLAIDSRGRGKLSIKQL